MFVGKAKTVKFSLLRQLMSLSPAMMTVEFDEQLRKVKKRLLYSGTKGDPDRSNESMNFFARQFCGSVMDTVWLRESNLYVVPQAWIIAGGLIAGCFLKEE
ncbi:unnamed protein product [Dovyalis caffra]|uniref:Uncharacterized protein n=1 Tax=Dovyalis caffra TaxID=77055 RepID=A0AAV1RJF4_9ROSI|nr:unnamed protein product [Dovyalis caffra]